MDALQSPNRKPDLLLVEPWFGGSHRRWIEEYIQHSKLHIEVLSLPARYWKWRMQGGAQNLSRKFQEEGWQPARILVSDMLDLPTFLGLLRKELGNVPTDIYFHENQIQYPWSQREPAYSIRRDQMYGYRNVVSAVAADRVFFNSGWHRRTFLEALPEFLDQFPDKREKQAVSLIRRKSKALPLGLDLQAFDRAALRKSDSNPKPQDRVPVLVWNHRWEYDKNPTLFFDTLIELKDQHNFQLIVLGQETADPDGIFSSAREQLADRILHWGPVSSRQEYADWLVQADILPVTSRHDFFGASVVEAMYAGCLPVLPNQWVYPEHLPEDMRHNFCYHGDDQFKSHLINALNHFGDYSAQKVRDRVFRYDWSIMAPVYDRIFGKDGKV
jgi:glycosyltransferase involved in cell wall biosynthesis